MSQLTPAERVAAYIRLRDYKKAAEEDGIDWYWGSPEDIEARSGGENTYVDRLIGVYKTDGSFSQTGNQEQRGRWQDIFSCLLAHFNTATRHTK